MANYENYGLLVNYQYCSNCHSCEVACQEEKGLEPGRFGIKVFEIGPYEKPDGPLDDRWEWNFLAVPTELCDLCSDRLDAGRKPMCVKHCLAACMEYGPMDELNAKLAASNGKVAVFRPWKATPKDIGCRKPEDLADYTPHYEKWDFSKKEEKADSQQVLLGMNLRPSAEIIPERSNLREAFVELSSENRAEYLNARMKEGATIENLLSELDMDNAALGLFEVVVIDGIAKVIPKRNTI